MLTRILNLFKGHEPDPLPEPDARLALGALMVRVAKSDSDYRFEEISLIDRLLAQMNGLNPVEAAKMRATCEKIEAAAPGTKKFALLIRETVSFEARLEAHEALWQVMLADGDSNDAELAVVTQVREALGLTEADCDEARARVAAK
ncbi:TerB family tellurite resistance protein [Pseudohalocynthiibacter aestuariivivens]|uniref:TerB family tellurite resistance protein n=1 Tax=Roseovarius pelagicus TaxID=2980108 RepID=A0ABY6DD28_9RHOB|nr:MULTISPECIES: TerB family tellurite resistance protein [Rhodobacterales]QIE44055.1 TerB family tellurite resistance protein [Pseudohalocynthiibacter aestuariivivens]UXX84046.1 TerB family tellurite resistance protein [Roseovarius pelagicus]